MSENENLQDNYANVSKLDGFEERIVEELNCNVCSYNKELRQYLSNKKRASKPESKVSKAIDMANAALRKFLEKLKEYEDLSKSPRSLARNEKLLALKNEISDDMVRLNFRLLLFYFLVAISDHIDHSHISDVVAWQGVWQREGGLHQYDQLQP